MLGRTLPLRHQNHLPGTRIDKRGVIIFGVEDGLLARGRVYREQSEAGDETWQELDEVLASDYTVHGVPGAEEELTGPDAIEAFIRDWNAAFPDMAATIEELVAEDATVAYRAPFTGTHEGEFMDIPATGETVSLDQTGFFRIEDGKLAEAWPQFDTLGMMQQLGVIEAPGE